MPRGGKREHAGRKAGSLTKRNRETAEQAIATGKTPLDVMLANMRYYQSAADDADAILKGKTAAEIIGMRPADEPMTIEDQVQTILAQVMKNSGVRDRATACAKEAAPFIHARISPVEANKRTDDFVPLVERLKAYAREDAIAASGNKVVVLKKTAARK
jgi:hypothetical protein